MRASREYAHEADKISTCTNSNAAITSPRQTRGVHGLASVKVELSLCDYPKCIYLVSIWSKVRWEHVLVISRTSDKSDLQHTISLHVITSLKGYRMVECYETPDKPGIAYSLHCRIRVIRHKHKC